MKIIFTTKCVEGNYTRKKKQSRNIFLLCVIVYGEVPQDIFKGVPKPTLYPDHRGCPDSYRDEFFLHLSTTSQIQSFWGPWNDSISISISILICSFCPGFIAAFVRFPSLGFKALQYKMISP